MILADKICSQDNKSLLWSVLLEHGAFIGINDMYFDQVHETFESLFKNIPQNTTGPIGDINKQILRDMNEQLGYFKRPVTDKQSITSPDLPKSALRENYKEQRVSDIAIKTKQMTDEFNRYITPPPIKKEVHFSDDVDKMSPELLEERLQRAISIRKLDSDDSTQPNNVLPNNVLPNETIVSNDIELEIRNMEPTHISTNSKMDSELESLRRDIMILTQKMEQMDIKIVALGLNESEKNVDTNECTDECTNERIDESTDERIDESTDEQTN